MVTVRKKFDIIQVTSERDTLNDEYGNFVTAHLRGAAEWIPAKPRVKYEVLIKSTVVWEK